MLSLFNVFDDMMRLDPWFTSPYISRESVGSWPEVNVAEGEEGYRISADLPGVKPEDVRIQLENGVLTISGERRSESNADQNMYRYAERRYGAFSRSFTLPTGVKGDAINAELKDGVLTIHLPKDETARPRQIPVKQTGSPELTAGDAATTTEQNRTEATVAH